MPCTVWAFYYLHNHTGTRKLSHPATCLAPCFISRRLLRFNCWIVYNRMVCCCFYFASPDAFVPFREKDIHMRMRGVWYDCIILISIKAHHIQERTRFSKLYIQIHELLKRRLSIIDAFAIARRETTNAQERSHVPSDRS